MSARFTAVLLLSCSLAWAKPASGAEWEALQFMQGKWVGEGTSELGQGSGYFSFEPDLLGKVWIRRNHSEYPGANNGPATVHEDIMIVYADSGGKATRAFYSDTEGHTIQYSVSVSEDGKTLTFLGELEATRPR